MNDDDNDDDDKTTIWRQQISELLKSLLNKNKIVQNYF